MKVKILIRLLTTLLAIASLAEAQSIARVPRIALLSANTPQIVASNVEAFRQGMHRLGYVEGKNIIVEYSYAGGELDRLRSLADDLVRLKVDVIVTSSTPATLAVKNATKEIPIVFHAINDPVETGLVTSFAQPGGNVTGVTMGGAALYGKRLELLKETIPKLTRASFLWNPTTAAGQLSFKEIQAASQALKLQIQSLEVRTLGDIEPAFDAAIRAKSGAGVITQIPPITTHAKKIIELATKHRLPLISPQRQWPETGSLMSYGSNVDDSYRRLATFVDRILKGMKPADLPVERSTKLELVINLKAAEQIRLTIPQRVLLKADRVIR